MKKHRNIFGDKRWRLRKDAGPSLSVTVHEGPLSGEHYFTAGLFEGNKVFIFGLDWCKEKPKEIGKKSLVKKILCKSHNERLSILDDEAIKAFKIVAEERRGELPFLFLFETRSTELEINDTLQFTACQRKRNLNDSSMSATKSGEPASRVDQAAEFRWALQQGLEVCK